MTARSIDTSALWRIGGCLRARRRSAPFCTWVADKRFKQGARLWRQCAMSQCGHYVDLLLATGRERGGFKERFPGGRRNSTRRRRKWHARKPNHAIGAGTSTAIDFHPDTTSTREIFLWGGEVEAVRNWAYLRVAAISANAASLPRNRPTVMDFPGMSANTLRTKSRNFS